MFTLTYNYSIFAFILFCCSSIVLSREEWIDPHDMNIGKIDISDNKIVTNKKNQQSASTVCDCTSTSSPNFGISHYKRMIQLLLGSVVIDPSADMLNFKGHLYLNIPLDDYDKLKSFASSNIEEDPATLRRIDKILSQILIKPSFQHVTESLISWVDHIYFTFYNRTSGVLLSCLLVVLISYKLLKASLTIWVITKYLVFLLWVTDFAFTWIHLLQEAEINKMADSLQYSSIPWQCKPNEMSTWQYIKYSFGSTDSCREYHHIFLKDHFWSVGPVIVLSHQCGNLILTPAIYVGKALGTFTNGILSTLPWGVNILLLPFLLVFTCIILCIFFSFITQTSFSCNILHVLQLQFGKNERRAVGDILSGHNLSVLTNLLHRNMIEEVRQANNTVESTNTSEDSNFREACNSENVIEKCEDSKSETKAVCDNENKSNIGKSDKSKPHDGSGDKIECIDSL